MFGNVYLSVEVQDGEKDVGAIDAYNTRHMGCCMRNDVVFSIVHIYEQNI